MLKFSLQVEKESAVPTPATTEEPRREVEAVTTAVPSASTPRPSRDWSKEFTEPRSLAEAEKLYAMFLVSFELSKKEQKSLSEKKKHENGFILDSERRFEDALQVKVKINFRVSEKSLVD